MANRSGILLETPALAIPSGSRGLISTLVNYSIKRTLNQGGTFSLVFPVTEPLSVSLKMGWRVSLTEENNDPDTYPGWLLRRGKITKYRYVMDESGQAQLAIEGITPLGILTEKINHIGLENAEVNLAGIAGAVDPDDSFFVPARTNSQEATVTFSDQTQLAELVQAGELFRCNLRERFTPENEFDYVDQEDVPDSGYRFVQMEHAPVIDGQELARAGVGLITSIPSIDIDGSQVVNMITPVGADWDGKPLTLEHANLASPYDVHVGTNPDSTPYYFIRDDESIEQYGLIETQLVRADVKNPNNPTLDGGVSRTQAANALYMLSCSTLLQRRSEMISGSIAVANGDSIWALPGDRVHVRYVGKARMSDGMFTWLDIDSPMLVVARTDNSSAGGLRQVIFDVISYTSPLTIPSLPDAIPIPPPYQQPPTQDPYDPGDYGDGGGGDGGGGDTPGDTATEPEAPPDFSLPPLTDVPPGPTMGGPTPYQPCCVPPTDINVVPPSSVTPSGGGGDVITGGGRLPSVDAASGGSGWPLEVNVSGAVAGDKLLIFTWSHGHDGDPATVTPSAAWLTGVASIDNIVADDGDPKDVSGSTYDILSGGRTKLQVWVGNVAPGGGDGILTLTNGVTDNWPTGGSKDYSFGAFCRLLHNPNPSDPIPQVSLEAGAGSTVTHSLTAPDPTSQYIYVGFSRGATPAIVTPVGWNQYSIVHQDIELSGFGELLHDQELQNGGVHSADGETTLEWDATGGFIISAVVEVKPA